MTGTAHAPLSTIAMAWLLAALCAMGHAIVAAPPVKQDRFIGTIQTGAAGADEAANWTALCKDRLKLLPKFAGEIQGGRKDLRYKAAAYRSEKGENLIKLWREKGPDDGPAPVERLTVVVPASLWMISPVRVDLASGKVYKCTVAKEQGARMTFRNVPVGDTPVVLAHLGMLPFAPPTDPPCVEPVPGEGYRLLGTVRPRHAREIGGSNWSVGAETMDRDYTVYKNWREYLGPLGAKHARVQSGWPKTERQKGKYDWAWLDEIIPDMAAQGVKPWLCLCYGNPDVYEGGGQGWSVPTSAEALAAWERYVAAIVERYGRFVDEWEIWNEPASPLDEYSAFVIRTAKVIRRVQPRARIIVAAWRDVPAILAHLKEHEGLKLVDEFTIHPYTANPDGAYTRASKVWRVAALREQFAAHGGHITLRQGENGVPSCTGSGGALPEYAWTEPTQAKWLLRRLLGDLGWDLPSSYFSICDMKYPNRINYKGLLAVREDKTVDHVKPSYHAMQRVTAIFDDTVHRVPDFAGTVAGAAEGNSYTLYGYRTNAGASVVTLWRDAHRPGERPEIEPITVTLPGVRFAQPVLVDLLTGRVYAIAPSHCTEQAGTTVVRGVPGYDSVVLLADEGAIPLARAAKP